METTFAVSGYAIESVFMMHMFKCFLQLLKPHVRFTTAINAVARKELISEGGVITKVALHLI